MAYVKVSTTKNAIAALRYGEHEKSVIRGGVDCPEDTETAIKLFKADRVMWNKDNGLQAHVIIQSFDGKECTPEEANRLGQELARRVAPGHRAMVYTHQESEGGNIHNHIVICAVSHENGRKLDTSGMLWKSRDTSNEISREHGLSVIQYGREAGVFVRSADLNYTQAERGLLDKGETSWKDNIREAVDKAKANSRSLDEFRANLQEKGITIHERGSRKTESGKQWTYCVEHEGKQCKARGEKLGNAYTLESVEKAVSRERVSALERVQQMEQNKTSALDRAESLINAPVQKGKEQDKAAELARREAERAARLAKEREEQQKKKSVVKTKTITKTKELTLDTGRGWGR